MTRLNKQEFLAWAYDDLLTNTTRGVLAEYIVATANAATGELIRELTIDPTRNYQPRGVRPGRPKKKPEP